MQDVNRLKQLRDQIVGIEMNISLIQADLIAVNGDIEFLENHATVLKENITILKSDNIIAVASEYKQVVIELKAVEENLVHYYNIRSQLHSKHAQHMRLKDISIIEFEDLKQQLDNRKVVLLFDPSKRKHEG